MGAGAGDGLGLAAGVTLDEGAKAGFGLEAMAAVPGDTIAGALIGCG